MNAAEIIGNLAETNGWSSEVLDSQNLIIKYISDDSDKETPFMIQLLWPLRPDHLVTEISSYGMPTKSQDNDLGAKILELALKRNMEIKLIKWGVLETEEESALWIKFPAIIKFDEHSTISGLENAFKLMIKERDHFFDSFMSEVCGLPEDLLKGLQS